MTQMELDDRVKGVVSSERLTVETNAFFQKARLIDTVEAEQVYLIAINWREITKQFLFTSLIGLGFLADQINIDHQPKESDLSAFCNIYAILADDLTNQHSVFQQYAPEGIDGIHYRWWEKTILHRLQNQAMLSRDESPLLPNVHHLTLEMQKLSKHKLGVAVQLRIVEAVAYDISCSFYDIFSRAVINGEKVFHDDNELAWMVAHIEAEKYHCKQVCDPASGMTKLVQTNDDAETFLSLASTYCKAWCVALESFGSLLP